MALTIPCTGCSVRLKLPEGKKKVRCPRCGTLAERSDPSAPVSEPVAARPPARARTAQPAPEEPEEVEELEEVEQLEEVDEAPARPRRRRDEAPAPAPRPKRKKRRVSNDEGPWVIALGVAGACFVVGFLATLIGVGTAGLPDNKDQGGYPMKVICLLGAAAIGVVLAFVGVIGVKHKVIYDRWGNAITGPMAIILSMVTTICGAALTGFGAYAVLITLILGR